MEQPFAGASPLQDTLHHQVIFLLDLKLFVFSGGSSRFNVDCVVVLFVAGLLDELAFAPADLVEFFHYPFVLELYFAGITCFRLMPDDRQFRSRHILLPHFFFSLSCFFLGSNFSHPIQML